MIFLSRRAKPATLITLLQIALAFVCGNAFADDAPAASNTSVTSSAPSSGSGGYDVYEQLVSISAGEFVPRSAVISNKSYSFNYGNSKSSPADTFLVEAGWSARLFDAFPGAFYVSEGITYSRFSGSASSSMDSVEEGNLVANLFGLDSRINYSFERFPIRWFIPFAEAGYMATFYTQTGASDLDSVQGLTGNFVAGAGVRLWLNRHSSLNSDLKGVYDSIPVFLTLRWNRIFANGSSLDLADSQFMGGLSIGL